MSSFLFFVVFSAHAYFGNWGGAYDVYRSERKLNQGTYRYLNLKRSGAVIYKVYKKGRLESSCHGYGRYESLYNKASLNIGLSCRYNKVAIKQQLFISIDPDDLRDSRKNGVFQAPIYIQTDQGRNG